MMVSKQGWLWRKGWLWRIGSLGLVVGLISMSLFSGGVAWAGQTIHTNSADISIPDSGAATPYPSTISVSGLVGPITQVTVTLTNLSHTYPDDIDVLLVGPGGQSVLLMSDVGGDSGVRTFTVTFDDGAASTLPDEAALSSGTYRPSDADDGQSEESPDSADDIFPDPAPAGPYGAALATFIGTDPNGTWRLFVFDDVESDTGTIDSWTLTITVADPTPTPTATATPTATTTPLATATATVTPVLTPTVVPTMAPTATATATPRPQRDPSDLSVNDSTDRNLSRHLDEHGQPIGVYERLQGISTTHGGSSIGQPSNGDPAAVRNSVPGGTTTFGYSVIVGNRNPSDRSDAPGPNKVVIDLPAGLTLAGLTVEANSCRGMGRGPCADGGSDDDWALLTDSWQGELTLVEGRQRLIITNIPTIRWGQRIRISLRTSQVPPVGSGSDLLQLDAWVEPTRNERGGRCEPGQDCPATDRWANNWQRFVTRIE